MSDAHDRDHVTLTLCCLLGLPLLQRSLLPGDEPERGRLAFTT